ncbi:MAG: bifunctional proline dehydrogenase/L-glutamate gamma-semialdehyde dehydrogenase, partial [Pseudomonadota bacterium]
IVLESFKSLLMEPGLRDWPDVGIAMQAYLRENQKDLEGLIEWVAARGAPITVRLVRGAYWDYETVIAKQHGWPVPVWERKPDTDAAYERCLRLLMMNHASVRPAVATHNLRSIALAMALADEYALSKDRFEFQMLFGMADDLKHALSSMDYCMRVYMPYGEPIPGMAYLVRRLLENASSQSFIFDAQPSGLDLERLLSPPETGDAAEEKAPEGQHGEGPGGLPPFRNEPVLRFTASGERDGFSEAIEGVRSQLGETYPLIINGRAVENGSYIDSVNPACPTELVGRVAKAGLKEADRAVEGALASLAGWSETQPDQRAQLLLKAAALLRARRMEFAAWEIFEAGKTWREADANITETIDFLEYYARQALRMAQGRAVTVPGEVNFNGYRPCGVGVIIPPWNFPSAILMGMLCAAIVTGNTVILKPSSQTPVIAARLVDLLRQAGVPDGVVQFLPGPGGEVGDYLVRHPGVHFIAFTGSEEVGSRIIRLAAEGPEGQHHVKRVVAEMGGKNAIIVDTDADPDEVVKGVVQSAFGYQGQKCSACSRLIIVGEHHDEIVGRLVDAAKSIEIGMPENPGVFMGPVIEQSARQRILDAIAAGEIEAELALFRNCSEVGNGYFVGPAVFVGVPRDSMLAQKEIFGPLLAVMRAKSLEEAIEVANDSRYALTGGCYSRSPANIELVKRRLQVGNLYINRAITGALVERQAFGGFKRSGLGYKAGGPDYLLQFMNQSTWSENTLRHGFAPD